MSAPSEESPKLSRSPRRWLRFSLRTLLIVTTLVCVGIVAKQKYDWYWRQQLIHPWIAPLVELARAADGDVRCYPDFDPPRLTPPAGLPAEEQITLLRWGILELETPEERLAALKILVESHGEEALPVLRELIPECRHGELQATLLHVLAFARDPEDLPLMEKWLESPSAAVRAAAADSIGFVHEPAYGFSDAFGRWGGRCRLNTIPPIDFSMVDTQLLSKSLIRGLRPRGGAPVPSEKEMPAELRGLVETMMLSGETEEERTAAARALVGWPPESYKLRVAEWGVWLDDGGPGPLRTALLDENPAFVHTTGNPLATLPRNRFEGEMMILKPIIHLTAGCPLALDVEVSIAGGRPWYAFPRPDTMTIYATNISGLNDPDEETEWDKIEPAGLASLEPLSEGYPWIHPADRSNSSEYFIDQKVTAVGLRWQSLIVSPERQAWMSPPEVPDSPKFRWWSKLRDVPSAWITREGETERFLYYDGPTTARSPLKAWLEGARLTLLPEDALEKVKPSLRGFSGEPQTCLFIDARSTRTRAHAFAPPEGVQQVLALGDVDWLPGDKIEPTFRAMLLAQGLTNEEAAGLLDSWHERFFQAPGQRLLTLLTPAEYDRMCPLKVRPPATEMVRVGIVLREF